MSRVVKKRGSCIHVGIEQGNVVFASKIPEEVSIEILLFGSDWANALSQLRLMHGSNGIHMVVDSKGCIEVTTQYWQAPTRQAAHKFVDVSIQLNANVLQGSDCIWWYIWIDNAEVPSCAFDSEGSQSALED